MKRSRVGSYVRAHFRRRIFVWFFSSIILSILTVLLVLFLTGGASVQPWRRDMERMRTFVGGRFAAVWDQPAARDELARSMARDLELDVVLLDPQQHTLAVFGGVCDGHAMSAPVVRDGASLGTVEVCSNQARPKTLWKLLLGVFAACGVLWMASGKIARRLSRPLDELARVATDIGAGKFSSRASIPRGRHGVHGEVGMLSCVINDMAARIEKQMGDQRELLAAVSHEIRTPLQRIRILVEMARDRGSVDAHTLDEVDREVVEIDALVSELLASSRLHFSALTPAKLDAADVARRAIERAGLAEGKLVVEGDDRAFRADATLMARALANLIDNAKRHGGGLVRLRVKVSGARVRFEAEDSGPGFTPGDEARVFDPFVQRPSSNGNGNGDHDRGSLGLGLALVQRIAVAHGGSVDAGNLPEGGARVAIELPREPPPVG